MEAPFGLEQCVLSMIAWGAAGFIDSSSHVALKLQGNYRGKSTVSVGKLKVSGWLACRGAVWTDGAAVSLG